MDLREAIRTTGSVREFRDEPVADDVVTAVLDDARFAPSGGNRQPWRVAVVKDPTARRAIGELMQPIWNEYWACSVAGGVPFNSVDYQPPTEIDHAPNPLIDHIDTIPVVLAIAADLRRIVALDAGLDRAAVVPGASIYPFCWNALLSARAHGLGGVLTTFLSRVESAASEHLHLPEHHALAAVLFLGYPVRQPTKLRRSPVSSFASLDSFDGAPFG
jgi:nitroreductase